MKNNIFVFLILLAGAAVAAGAGPVIDSINISGNAVRGSIIRKHLGFKEGDAWKDELTGKAKANLFRLKIFKELEITSEPSASSDTVKVNIRAVDGSFFFPLPMVSYKGGQQSFLLILTEQNLWRSAERVSLFTSFRGSVFSPLFMFSMDEYSLTLGEWNTSDIEYAYSDGGFSRHVFDKGAVKVKPGDLGTVTAEYKREVSEPLIMAGRLIAGGIRLSAGVRSTSVRYEKGASGLMPDDSGTMNCVVLSAASEEMDTIKDSDGFGRMFGLGMAEVREMILTGKRLPSLWLWNVTAENSGKILPSDFPYTKASLSLARKTVFRKRNAITASTRFTSGTSLPLSRMPAASQQDGLRGYYAREFKGDSAVNSYASYTHPLFMTMKGYFNIESFFDWGVCYAGGARKDRTGAGLNLSYRFWRFPIPIGCGCTYSFDDNNWQAVFAFGGRF